MPTYLHNYCQGKSVLFKINSHLSSMLSISLPAETKEIFKGVRRHQKKRSQLASSFVTQIQFVPWPQLLRIIYTA